EAGVAHALDHHLREQPFELARGLVDAGGIGAQRGIELDGGRVDAHQITSSSARRAPACFSASRMATRSPGAAPTAFTACTISSSEVPPGNMNMRLPSWLASTAECGVTTVWPPREKAPGWLTSVCSVMVTVSEPCAIAAGITRTWAP